MGGMTIPGNCDPGTRLNGSKGSLVKPMGRMKSGLSCGPFTGFTIILLLPELPCSELEAGAGFGAFLFPCEVNQNSVNDGA